MIYDDSNYQELLGNGYETLQGRFGALPRQTRYASPEAAAIGLVPMLDYPQAIPPKSDWKAIIEDCHARKIFPMYHREASGLPMKANQNGLGFCWAFGITRCVEDVTVIEGGPAIKLAPTSLGWLVNWRNQGYFCDRAIEGAKDRGIAPASMVPDLSISPSQFTAGWQEEALKHRPLEWWDTSRADGAERMVGQALAILMTGRPGYVAFNWWGHALELVGFDWDEKQPYSVNSILNNSHNDGIIRIGGTKGVPDELYGPRAVTLVTAS